MDVGSDMSYLLRVAGSGRFFSREPRQEPADRESTPGTEG
jgi:hypothetical protein